MLPGLRHHAVERRDHQDRAVDLRRTGDHVLHVVRVAGHVDVRVVPGRGLVLDVRDVDGDPPRGLLGRAVDLPERHVTAHAPVRQDLRDGGGESGLPVVDVPHRADVEVRLVADVGLLGHDWLLLVPPAALADPRADSTARCATLPRQVTEANGEGSASRAVEGQQARRRQQCRGSRHRRAVKRAGDEDGEPEHASKRAASAAPPAKGFRGVQVFPGLRVAMMEHMAVIECRPDRTRSAPWVWTSDEFGQGGRGRYRRPGSGSGGSRVRRDLSGSRFRRERAGPPVERGDRVCPRGRRRGRGTAGR